MSYFRRVRKGRTACLMDGDVVEQTPLGQFCVWPRAAWTDAETAPARVTRVLCCRCREYHEPAGVATCMGLPRKVEVNGRSGTSSSRPLDPGVLKPFPTLWEFLTLEVEEDGYRRQTGALSFSFGSGLVGISLNCKETGRYAFLEGSDVDELLLVVEDKLKSGTMPWRASKYGDSKKKK